MKVTVESVSDNSFDGKDGRVAAANLTFSDGNGSRTLTGYGPGMAQVLAWRPGEEHEIESYTTKSGKPAFRLPQSARPGGGGRSFETAFRNTREGHVAEQAGLDRRTALMQAVAVDPKAGIRDILTKAANFYEWLRETANGS